MRTATTTGPVAAVEEYQKQLAWREFYTQVLYHNPEVVTENYKEYEEGIAWRDDPDEIAAWKRGETGYPIVDAGMRQLRERGVHAQPRADDRRLLPLTKDLLADWRHGYDYFRETLADHDTANDSGGWQWAASTGTDAQPYFRIFNPMTQGSGTIPTPSTSRDTFPSFGARRRPHPRVARAVAHAARERGANLPRADRRSLGAARRGVSDV